MWIYIFFIGFVLSFMAVLFVEFFMDSESLLKVYNVLCMHRTYVSGSSLEIYNRLSLNARKTMYKLPQCWGTATAFRSYNRSLMELKKYAIVMGNDSFLQNYHFVQSTDLNHIKRGIEGIGFLKNKFILHLNPVKKYFFQGPGKLTLTNYKDYLHYTHSFLPHDDLIFQIQHLNLTIISNKGITKNVTDWSNAALLTQQNLNSLHESNQNVLWEYFYKNVITKYFFAVARPISQQNYKNYLNTTTKGFISFDRGRDLFLRQVSRADLCPYGEIPFYQKEIMMDFLMSGDQFLLPCFIRNMLRIYPLDFKLPLKAILHLDTLNFKCKEVIEICSHRFIQHTIKHSQTEYQKKIFLSYFASAKVFLFNHGKLVANHEFLTNETISIREELLLESFPKNYFLLMRSMENDTLALDYYFWRIGPYSKEKMQVILSIPLIKQYFEQKIAKRLVFVSETKIIKKVDWQKHSAIDKTTLESMLNSKPTNFPILKDKILLSYILQLPKENNNYWKTALGDVLEAIQNHQTDFELLYSTRNVNNADWNYVAVVPKFGKKYFEKDSISGFELNVLRKSKQVQKVFLKIIELERNGSTLNKCHSELMGNFEECTFGMTNITIN